MGAGIGAGDHRNDGARRLTAASHYKEVGGEEEGPFRPRTHPGACGWVGEGAGCQDGNDMNRKVAARGGEEVDGDLDFRRPGTISGGEAQIN